MSPPEIESPTIWRSWHAVVVLALLGFFLVSVRPILNPFVLFVLLAFAASPYAGSRQHLLLVASTGILTLVWLLNTTGFLLAPFVLALVLAYVLHPLVERLEGRRLSRSTATLLLALPLVAVLALLLLVGVPALAAQAGEMLGRTPELIRTLSLRLDAWQTALHARDLPWVDEGAIVSRLGTVQPEEVVAWLQARQAAIAAAAWGGILGVGRGVSAVLSLLGYVFLTPILTFYLLRDWRRLEGRMADLLPRQYRARVIAFATEYDTLLARYLRGQLLAASIVGALTWIGFLIAGFPYALLLGAITAVFNVIPYMGLVASLLPALAIALFSPAPGIALLKIAVVFAVVQALDGTVIGPRIVGEAVGLHPVWVLLALAVSGSFFGFVGLLIAVPLAVLAKLLLRGGLERYRASSLFRGERPLIALE
jgi:predicted PurR-regulated permease PerM